MNRFGFQINNFLDNINFIIESNIQNNLKLDLIMSHLACSESLENEYNKIQLHKFNKVLLEISSKSFELY